MDLMPKMIERKDGLVEHQHGIVHAEIVNAGLRNVFDRSNHVVSEITDRAARERRKIGQLHGFKAVHRSSQVLNKVGGLSVTVMRYEKWLDTEKRVPRDPFATFNALEKKGVRPVLLQLQKCRDRRQEIRNDGFVHGNHVPPRLKVF